MNPIKCSNINSQSRKRRRLSRLAKETAFDGTPYSHYSWTAERLNWAREHDAHDVHSARAVSGYDEGPNWLPNKPVVKLPSGDYYQGDFCDKSSIPHGHGIFYYNDPQNSLHGSWYEGPFLKGEAVGIGKRTWRKDCKTWLNQKVRGDQKNYKRFTGKRPFDYAGYFYKDIIGGPSGKAKTATIQYCPDVKTMEIVIERVIAEAGNVNKRPSGSSQSQSQSQSEQQSEHQSEDQNECDLTESHCSNLVLSNHEMKGKKKEKEKRKRKRNRFTSMLKENLGPAWNKHSYSQSQSSTDQSQQSCSQSQSQGSPGFNLNLSLTSPNFERERPKQKNTDPKQIKEEEKEEEEGEVKVRTTINEEGERKEIKIKMEDDVVDAFDDIVNDGGGLCEEERVELEVGRILKPFQLTLAGLVMFPKDELDELLKMLKLNLLEKAQIYSAIARRIESL